MEKWIAAFIRKAHWSTRQSHVICVEESRTRRFLSLHWFKFCRKIEVWDIHILKGIWRQLLDSEAAKCCHQKCHRWHVHDISCQIGLVKFNNHSQFNSRPILEPNKKVQRSKNCHLEHAAFVAGNCACHANSQPASHERKQRRHSTSIRVGRTHFFPINRCPKLNKTGQRNCQSASWNGINQKRRGGSICGDCCSIHSKKNENPAATMRSPIVLNSENSLISFRVLCLLLGLINFFNHQQQRNNPHD